MGKQTRAHNHEPKSRTSMTYKEQGRAQLMLQWSTSTKKSTVTSTKSTEISFPISLKEPTAMKNHPAMICFFLIFVKNGNTLALHAQNPHFYWSWATASSSPSFPQHQGQLTELLGTPRAQARNTDWLIRYSGAQKIIYYSACLQQPLCMRAWFPGQSSWDAPVRPPAIDRAIHKQRKNTQKCHQRKKKIKNVFNLFSNCSRTHQGEEHPNSPLEFRSVFSNIPPLGILLSCLSQ